MNEIWTIKKILDWTQNYFRNKNFSSPRLDAELLLTHILKLSRMELYLKFDRPLNPQELADYKTLIKRRSEFEPIAYILGTKDFYSRTFIVSPHVLVPRPDSEVLIEIVLKELQASTQDSLIGFEMGLGSGCLSLTLLAENPKIKMMALDISELAINVAKQNAFQFKLEDRFNTYLGNFLEDHIKAQTPWCNTEFDFVISNPPYISEGEYHTLNPDVTAYEPKIALTAGERGLDFYAPLATFAQKTLKINGVLAVEIGNEQAQDVMNIFQLAGFCDVICKKDYANQDRVIMARKSNNLKN